MSAAREFLAAVQQRADAATDGPWSRHDYGNAAAQESETIVVHTGKFDWADLSDPEGASAVAWMGAWDSQDDRNAEFIAAARTDVQRLVAFALAVLNEMDDCFQSAALSRAPGEYMIDPRIIRDLADEHLTPKENDS